VTYRLLYKLNFIVSNEIVNVHSLLNSKYLYGIGVTITET